MDFVFYEKLERLEKKIDEIKESLDKKEVILNQFPFECCSGCAYESFEEWALPCCKCSRGTKDYYRREGNESK